MSVSNNDHQEGSNYHYLEFGIEAKVKKTKPFYYYDFATELFAIVSGAVGE